MPNPYLDFAATREVLSRLEEELGRADLRRLEALLGLPTFENRVRLSDALAALYPQQGRELALAGFRQLRQRLRSASEAAGVELRLAVDSRNKSEPEERWCWFEGDDPSAMQLAVFARAEAAASPVLDPVAQKAVLVEVEDGKRVVEYFVSYAHGDKPAADDLLARLRLRFENAPGFRFRQWRDTSILPGDHWHQEIQQAIERCQLGLLLVSHAFFASSYITKQELSRFVPRSLELSGGRRRAIPVGLKRVPLDGTADLKGLEALQIFRDGEGRSFTERSAENTKDRFADELFEKILRIAQRAFPGAGSPGGGPALPGPVAQAVVPDEPEGWVEDLLCRLPGGDGVGMLRSRAVLRSLQKMEDDREDGSGNQVDALEILLEWARDPAAAPFCALLGEYGMGKTTLCEALTRELAEAHRQDPQQPVPVYVDLRRLGDRARQEPALGEILTTVLRYSTRSGESLEASAADRIVSLVREGKAVAIFDGLDEVLVHLTPAAGLRFTRQLWSILPAPVRRQAPARGKLLISCRTHFFRTLRDQSTHFTGEDREGLAATDYRALLLLPFTPEQIEEYLAKHLPGADVPRLLELIRSVHNLPEMAERPYTLSLIAQHIPQLERWKAEGRKVSGVTLYRHMAQSWLERDTGKHQLTPDHKLRLMEHFAAALWRSGRRAWSVADVEQWLIDFLAAEPRIAAHYAGKDRELLKEDLRTATFLVREGEDTFRFAHTSLQEFFLASYLRRGLLEQRFATWELAVPSRETLDFLGQLFAEDQGETWAAAWRALRGEYRPQVSEFGLAYAALAHAKGYPVPVLAGWRLDGADLRDVTLAGNEGEPLLNVRGASFRGAWMRGCRIERVDLSDCDFEGADLTRAELLACRARGTRLARARLVGTIFREADLAGSSFAEAELYRTQLLRCRLEGVEGLDATSALLADCEPRDRFPRSEKKAEGRLRALIGHVGGIRSCGFSPTGDRLVSAGSDGTVRLWSASSGEALSVLSGHSDVVRSCGFSPTGKRLVSAGDDGTVRLWDASSGEALSVLSGHSGRVESCDFSPKGDRLVSAGSDGTVRLWDASSGEALSVLRGHSDWVRSCGFSPSGDRLMSAGDDGTVRLWDTSSGEVLLVLSGHSGWVLSCDFSPTGDRLVSAGEDGTVRLWDASSGEALSVLSGHSDGIRSCGFSPTGDRVVSGGSDGTVRLWDTSSGEALSVLRGHSGPVLSCGFSPMGDRLVSSGLDGTVRLWDASSGEALLVLRGHSGGVSSCGFSSAGDRLVSAGDDGTVRLWDASSGEALLVLSGHSGEVWSCGFSLTGDRLVSAGSDGTVRLWNASAGEALLVLSGHSGGVLSCGFSPTEDRLVSAGSDGTVRLWDASSGAALAVLRGHSDWVWSCSFSPTGYRLVSAGSDGTVRLWDASSGEALAVLSGHSGRVLSCDFSPTGDRLVSAGFDGTVRLWDASSGAALSVLRGHSSRIRSCGFSPTGDQLVSAGDDGTVRLWDASSGECSLVIQFLPNGEHAVLQGDGSGAIEVTPGAWRWLGWQVKDPVTGRLDRLPAETYGPLPVKAVPGARPRA